MSEDEKQMFADLETQFDEPDLGGTVDLAGLRTDELLDRFEDTRETLLTIGQMLNPTTAEARELHSIRAACLIEMRKRGLR